MATIRVVCASAKSPNISWMGSVGSIAVAYIQESMLEWQKGENNMQLEDEMRSIKLQQIMADMGVEYQVPDRVGFMRKARKSDMEAFRRHCMAGHKPWRSDCAACLDGCENHAHVQLVWTSLGKSFLGLSIC